MSSFSCGDNTPTTLATLATCSYSNVPISVMFGPAEYELWCPNKGFPIGTCCHESLKDQIISDRDGGFPVKPIYNTDGSLKSVQVCSCAGTATTIQQCREANCSGDGWTQVSRYHLCKYAGGTSQPAGNQVSEISVKNPDCLKPCTATTGTDYSSAFKEYLSPTPTGGTPTGGTPSPGPASPSILKPLTTTQIVVISGAALLFIIGLIVTIILVSRRWTRTRSKRN